jgi:hypothetical protein
MSATRVNVVRHEGQIRIVFETSEQPTTPESGDMGTTTTTARHWDLPPLVALALSAGITAEVAQLLRSPPKPTVKAEKPTTGPEQATRAEPAGERSDRKNHPPPRTVTADADVAASDANSDQTTNASIGTVTNRPS